MSEGVHLTATERVLYGALRRANGLYVSWEEFTTALGFADSTNIDRLVRVHMCNLRKKLRVLNLGYVEAFRGLGYRWSDEPIAAVPAPRRKRAAMRKRVPLCREAIAWVESQRRTAS